MIDDTPSQFRGIPRDEIGPSASLPRTRRVFFGLCATQVIVVGGGSALIGVFSPRSFANALFACTPPGGVNTCQPPTPNSCSSTSPNTCAANTCSTTNECLGAGANTCTTSPGSGNNCTGNNTCSGPGTGNSCSTGPGSTSSANTCGGSGGGSNTCENNLSSNQCTNGAGAAAGNSCVSWNQCSQGTNGLANSCVPGAANTCSGKNVRIQYGDGTVPLPI